jgi:hypothetical protein
MSLPVTAGRVPAGDMDTTLLTGYARCSTDEQDLTAQTEALLVMGVPAERIYTDKGLIRDTEINNAT